ncbi:hypothetical protein AB0B27_23110 [Micromonospora rifamycinica]|uniref:hypothetical protein n=1 Tax=Micromonospora rifamycinica TaxID=291594 RepID=UPI0033D65C58
MQRRHSWEELPDRVRDEVSRHVGPIRLAVTVPSGASCDLAVTLDTAGGTFFCKGCQVDGPTDWLHRNEARVNRWLPPAAPRLRWTVERSGWLLLGFEYVPGRHPDLAPGSPDLAPLADLLAGLAHTLTPAPPVSVQRFTDRWRDLIAPQLVDGDTLLHTDMTPRNFLLGGRLRLVDWSSPARGAPWIDTAFLVLRLVRAGHEPADAEKWAARIPAFAAAPGHAVTAFAGALVQLWERKQHTAPASHHGPLLAAARCWAAYRSRSGSYTRGA